ncbi:Copia protein [Colletotrichum fructicola Nara gc5]|uniref:Copia protein n=3 Tax=Colletotrichum fructicola (strain Nara gc5) TaxID=1213859 RepID=A0A7J6IDP8_COLFN|nr:Copia protein [Colletotrichum fructicola Nara gc5]
MDTSKTTQRLESDADWVKWYNLFRMTATFHEVWPYVNPDGTEVLVEPRIRFPDVDAENYDRLLKVAALEHQDAARIHEKHRKGVLEVLKWINSSVNQVYLNQTTNQQSVRGIIVALREQLSPDSYARQQQVLHRYNIHRRTIKRTRLTEWLIVYQEIMEEAASAGVPALADSTTQVADFLNTVKEIAPEYYTGASFNFSRIAQPIQAQATQAQPGQAQDGVQQPPQVPSGVTQALEFKRWVRTFHPDWLTASKPPVSSTSFATWQGENEDNNSSSSQNNSSKKKEKRKPDCPACFGQQKHYIVDCWHMNPAKRRSHYDPEKDSNKKAIEAGRKFLKDHPRIQERLDKVLKEGSSGSSSTNWRQRSRSQSRERSNNTSYVGHSDDASIMSSADSSSDSSFCTVDSSLPSPSSFTSGFCLKDSVIIDCGTAFHVCNDITRMKDLDYSWQKAILTGGGAVQAVARGTMVVRPNMGGKGKKGIRVRDVWYTPDYPVTLVATEPLRKKGLFFTSKHPGMENSQGELLFKTPHQYGQYLLEYHAPQATETPPLSKQVTFQPTGRDKEETSFSGFKKSSDPVVSKAGAWLWHERLGHPGAKGLEELLNHSMGMKVTGITKDECAACSTAKAMRRVSRRPSDHRPTAPGDYIVIDFFTMSNTYNDEKYALIMGDRWSHFNWIRTLRTRKEGLDAIQRLVNLLEKQYFITVRVIRLDWETALRNAFDLWAAMEGILVERSADYTGAQNPAERLGGMLFMIARALRFQSRFPESMAPELIRAAVYLCNRIGHKILGWKTPEGVINEWLNQQPGSTHQRSEKPQLGHLKRYGCRAYPLTKEYKRGEQKSNKTLPRACIGYLCGYDSTTIYRIWVPALNKVLRTRDVSFDESSMYDPRVEDTSLLHRQELQFKFEELEMKFPDPQDEDLPMDSVLWDGDELLHEASKHIYLLQRNDHTDGPSSTLTPDQSLEPEGTQPGPSEGVDEQEQGQSSPESTPVLTPPTPDSTGQSAITQTAVTIEPEIIVSLSPSPQPTPQGPTSRRGRPIGSRNADIYNRETPIGQVNRQPPNATRSSGRRRNQRGSSGTSNFTLSTDTSKDKDTMDASAYDLGIIYRKDLPPEPTTYAEAKQHQYWPKWLAAMNVENKIVWKKGTFEAIRLQDVDQEEHRILPLRWVFTYKFDKHGRLLKFKARICVRGDLQPMNGMETYASTLAGRSFRSLMAVVARFNLDTIQLDAVNAFTNANLDEIVYVWFPPGFNRSGYCLILRKALYGLRRSPLLWQKSLKTTLMLLGVTPLDEDDCIFISRHLVIFIFVDDIAIAYRSRDKAEARKLINGLKSKYEMKEMGELNIFLGVRITRDRRQKKLWLCLDNYITKICDEFKVDRGRRGPMTPIGSDKLVPNPGQASPQEIHHYQRISGSINYAAIIARPDACYTSSRLSEFSTNPSHQHQQAANSCLSYLWNTRYFAIEFNCEGKGTLFCASDASFADDTVTRKSTQGYVMMLFGGPIAWKSSKQRRVVTSSTEAELVALTQATKEYLATIRLVKELQLEFDDDFKMQCDNQQTLRLLTAERPQATSKLRHININNLWLRQELRTGIIKYEWVKTNEMVADGTTKALPPQKHSLFLAQLGMTDVQKYIETADPTV